MNNACRRAAARWLRTTVAVGYMARAWRSPPIPSRSATRVRWFVIAARAGRARRYPCTSITQRSGRHQRPQLELIAEDDAYEPMRTIAAGKKSRNRQDRGLVSPAGTPNVTAMLPYSLSNKLPILFPTFSHALTNPPRPYVFTTLPEVRVQMTVLGEYILNTQKQRKIAAI